jgi:ABC-2 type transport system permease protein
MKQLISIEYAKLKKLTSIKVIILVYMVMVPLWMFFLSEMFEALIRPFLMGFKDIWIFPHIWNFSTFAASFFNLLMGIVVVIIVCNEYNFRTLKQNVIDGLSKKKVILSKFLVVFILATFVAIYTGLIALIFGFINSSNYNAFQDIQYISIYYLQALGYFSFAFFFAILVRKPALSIVFFIVSFIVEWIIGVILTIAISEKIYLYFPLNVFSKLTPNPLTMEFNKIAVKKGGQVASELAMSTNIILSFFYLSIFFLIAYQALKRRDL